MWEVTERQVVAGFQMDDGGARFTRFVNALIRAEMYLSRAPQSEFALVNRATVGDGGVDGEVKRAISDDRTGWLREYPTLWQFTARDGVDPTLNKLMNDLDKEYAVQLLAKGYAVRACIRGPLQPQDLDRWERELTNRARQHNASVPPVYVLTASRLAQWANMFPGVASEHLGVTLPLGIMCLHAWGRNATADTHTYVEVPRWATVKDSIGRHVDFGVQPEETVLDVVGESGVGKTRLTYETLKDLEGAAGLVVYASEGDVALNVASFLANNEHLSALLVVDECDARVSLKLADKLRGSTSRVRAVAIIGPESQRVRTRSDSSVEQMPTEILEQVLEKNFPVVGPADRRAIASQTQGFVRLASYMCHLAAASRGVSLDAALDHLDELVPRYVGSGSPLDALLTLALVKKVGFKDDMKRELESLCGLVGSLKPDEVSNAGKQLRDSCGFVGVSGRYMYVMPPIVARWAFERAWRKWAEDDASGFLNKVPPELLQVFLDQVSDAGHPEARKRAASFFEGWASALRPTDLTKTAVTDLLEALTETQPETYLPRLRKILESATDVELASIQAEGQSGRWGPRLHLVWLARHLAAFSGSFDDAEAILLRMATSESEGNWRHNAAGNWVNLFRMRLSGTEKPYAHRLALLRQRLFADNNRESGLALRALQEAIENALANFITGDSLPDFVGGKRTPKEWRADSHEEGVRLMHELLGLLREVATSTRPDIADPAADTLVGMTETLLDEHELEFLKNDGVRSVLTTARLPRVLQAIEVFLVRQERYVGSERRLPEAYLSDVRAWKAHLTPDDLHSRVVATTGRDAYFYTRAFRTTTEPTELVELAKELYSNPGAMSSELAWLLSPDAKSAEALGVEIGRLDTDASMLAFLYAESAKAGSVLLARGYTAGLLGSSQSAAPKVNEAIDSLEDHAPELAFECATAGGTATRVLERALSQVKLGRLKADRLAGFLWFVGDRRPTASEFAGILGAIAPAVCDMSRGLLSWAVTLVAYRLNDDGKGETEPILSHQEAREATWTFLEAVIGKGDLWGESSHWFPEILEELLKSDPERATSLATKGLMSEGIRLGQACERVLAQLARSHPTIVIKYLGPFMLDPKTAWRFHVDQHHGIFWAMDEDVLKQWLVENGLPAARALARHLPRPTLDKDHNPVVPSLTEYVLSKFEEDDGVAAAFAAGVHGMQVMVGDISAHMRSRADFARPFLGHPLRRIREWAEGEVKGCEEDARRFKQMEEERWL
jgi:hypothetical protein